MVRLELKIALRNYDRTKPILDGSVEASGIKLSPINMENVVTMFQGMLRGEFDVSEMSMAGYIIGKNQGVPLVGLPLFIHRTFRHGFIFINIDSGIKEPKDLVGKRVGISRYRLSAMVWVRGFLLHDYGVSPDKIEWFVAGDEFPDFSYPKDIKIEKIPEGKTLEGMLVSGELDCVGSPYIIRPFKEGNPKIRRLFPDYKRVETDYYKRTGIFPIMHLIVIKEDLYRENPWVVKSLVQAFDKAKTIAYENLKGEGKVSLVWKTALAEEEEEIFGKDPWPYNIRDNRKVLDTMVGYCLEQGLIEKRIGIEKLFPKEAFI